MPDGRRCRQGTASTRPRPCGRRVPGCPDRAGRGVPSPQPACRLGRWVVLVPEAASKIRAGSGHAREDGGSAGEPVAPTDVDGLVAEGMGLLSGRSVVGVHQHLELAVRVFEHGAGAGRDRAGPLGRARCLRRRTGVATERYTACGAGTARAWCSRHPIRATTSSSRCPAPHTCSGCRGRQRAVREVASACSNQSALSTSRSSSQSMA